MSFGGTKTVEVESTPDKQATKTLSAGAKDATEVQKQKAKKNKGLTSAILTNVGQPTSGGILESKQSGNKTLGG